MPSWAGWALAAGVLLITVVALWIKLSGKGPDALRAGAKLMEAWHEHALKAKQQRLAELKKDFDSNAKVIEKTEAKLKKVTAKLKKGYKVQGLTADEIAARFATISLPSRSDGRRGRSS